MRSEPYKVEVIDPDGTKTQAFYHARGSTHAWYFAMEMNPGCQINVLGLASELTNTSKNKD